MTEKEIKTRVQQKTDTLNNWEKATSFVPKKGEIIIYSDIKKFKVGDGTSFLTNLDFFENLENLELITVDDIDAICGDLSLDVNMTLTNFSVTDDGQGNVVIA